MRERCLHMHRAIDERRGVGAAPDPLNQPIAIHAAYRTGQFGMGSAPMNRAQISRSSAPGPDVISGCFAEKRAESHKRESSAGRKLFV